MNEDKNEKLLNKYFLLAVKDGIVLGLKESLKSLNGFLDEKTEMRYPEYISRNELNTFLETYISNTENTNILNKKDKHEEM